MEGLCQGSPGASTVFSQPPFRKPLPRLANFHNPAVSPHQHWLDQRRNKNQTVEWVKAWNQPHQFNGSGVNFVKLLIMLRTIAIIIHQTRHEKSDWSRAFNQFTIACELDMINAISTVDIAFIMSNSMSAWLLNPLECSPQKRNGRTLRFCFWGWIMWKMYVFAWYHELSKPRVCVICRSRRLRKITQTRGFDNSWYHAQPHPIIVYEFRRI